MGSQADLDASQAGVLKWACTHEVSPECTGAALSLQAHGQHQHQPAGTGTDTESDRKGEKGILPSQTPTCGNKLGPPPAQPAHCTKPGKGWEAGKE